MKGCLYLLAVPVGFVVACDIWIFGWPASGGLILLLLLRFGLKRWPNKWTKSAITSLDPFLWAMAVLAVLQTIFNNCRPLERGQAIVSVERLIVQASLFAPKWSKLGWQGFILITGTLALLSLLAPRAALVSRFLRGSKILSRIGSVLTALASFTFLGGELCQFDLDDTYYNIEARFRYLRTQLVDQTVHRVAIKATVSALDRMDDNERLYFLTLFQEIARTTSQKPAARAVTEALVDREFGAEPGVAFGESSSRPPGPTLSTAATDPLTELERDEDHLADLIKTNNETEKGLREILKKAAGVLPDYAQDVISDYIATLLHIESDSLLKEARRYLGNVANAYLEKATDPLIERAATYLKEKYARLNHGAVSDEILVVERETKAHLLQEAAKSAELATAQAASLKHVSSDDVQKSCDEIEKNVHVTESLVQTANAIELPQDFPSQDNDLVAKSTIMAGRSAEAAEILAKQALAEARAASAKAIAARAAAAEGDELLHAVRFIPK